MILHSRRCIFIEIQKTASSSIRSELGAQAGADHRTASEIQQRIGAALWNSYFSFAFVRNPWDRLVSAYFYRRSGGNQSPTDRQWAQRYPARFQDFCHALEEFTSLPGEHMFRSQTSWLTSLPEISPVRYVGRYETLQQDWHHVCMLTGIPFRPLPHLKKSTHDDYRLCYNETTRELIAARYQDDIRQFGYTFDPYPGELGR